MRKTAPNLAEATDSRNAIDQAPEQHDPIREESKHQEAAESLDLADDRDLGGVQEIAPVLAFAFHLVRINQPMPASPIWRQDEATTHSARTSTYFAPRPRKHRAI